jgi:hypothetical protein
MVIRYCVECGEQYNVDNSFYNDICNPCAEQQEGDGFMSEYDLSDNRVYT